MKLLAHFLACNSFSSFREPGSDASNNTTLDVRSEHLFDLVTVLTSIV